MSSLNGASQGSAMSGPSASRLRAADHAAQQPGSNDGGTSVVQSCTSPRFAIEVRVLGDDDQPLTAVAVELRAAPGRACRDKTADDGTVRFDGLPEGSQQVGLYELDKEVWEVLASAPLPAPQASSQGDIVWQAVSVTEPPPLVHMVLQGECTSKLADRYGFFPDTVWDWPDNAALKAQRRDKNILLPGDRLAIPGRRTKLVSAQTGQRLTLRRKGVPDSMRIQFLLDGRARSQVPYLAQVSYGDDTLSPDSSGETDADGYVTVALMPNAQTLTITLGTGQEAREHTFQIGAMDPATDCAGIQKRLANLGFYDGAVDGQPSAQLESAVARFQLSQDLEATGKLDPASLDKLLDLHRS
ncbi:peptidoglycan-binding domain-containing protein [Duganella vulcania]|uniref:Peptidoglycan binding-like domain-containing protein n=1 Tax=Duganella vulcania TaxID=2692166 RepID=A0A845GUC0_9BURK|nr:peptidoglycan-binding domain-containing protein [Duganella vulcania]MYM96257.1 hypothetical protein [Duganella vulcania]